MIGDIKHIVIIESLINERLTGKELYDNSIRRQIDFQNKDMTHKYFSVDSKEQLSEILKYYQTNAKLLTGGLLLHLEMHGDSNLKGLVLSDHSLIKWHELIDLFRPINFGTCNKLFVTMATCNGRYLYQGVDPNQKSPYSGYISASMSVYNDEIADKFAILFENLIETGNLISSYLEMEKTESNLYYKDSEKTFEESYQSVYDILTTNSEFKKKFIEDSKKQTAEAGQPVASDELIEEMFQQILKDIYVKQKEAFNFSDC